MSLINVYLKFNGNCTEAMSFYKSCLGGELYTQKYSEVGMGDGTPERDNRVIHSSLTNGTMILLAADAEEGERVVGNGMSISLNLNSAEEIKDAYEKLSEGGQQTYPLADAFWGATFGQLIDKYGNEWMLNYEHPKG